MKPVQNVVVELNYRDATPSGGGGSASTSNSQKSVFVGWTGMPSKRKAAPLIGRDGLNGMRSVSGSREQEVPLVEMDTAFARALGLQDGQKVTATIHMDPPLAHTIS